MKLSTIFLDVINLRTSVYSPKILRKISLCIASGFQSFIYQEIFPESPDIVPVFEIIDIVYNNIPHSKIPKVDFIHLTHFFPEVSAQSGKSMDYETLFQQADVPIDRFIPKFQTFCELIYGYLLSYLKCE